MFAGKNLGNIGSLVSSGFFNNMITFQDTSFFLINQYLATIPLLKKQNELILKNNKDFYDKFRFEYSENIDLKNKLSELNNEKKRLKNIIINLDKKLKNNNVSDKIENKNGKEEMRKISPYRKRHRRKKSEIINKYECSYPNCQKRYLTKCSLNMHIRLKHRIETKFDVNLDN